MFCSMRRLPEMLAAVPEMSNLLVLHAASSFSSLLASQSQQDSWIDQSVCHIKSTWLLVTFQLCLDEAQPVKKVLKTPYHIIILASLSPCHKSKESNSITGMCCVSTSCFGCLPSGLLALTQTSHQKRKGLCVALWD